MKNKFNELVMNIIAWTIAISVVGSLMLAAISVFTLTLRWTFSVLGLR